MSSHVDLEIADVVAGRLSAARRRELEQHLESCDECAADVNWARQLREQSLRQGLRHLSPARIVELAPGPGGASEAERKHLASCAQCRQEMDWAGGLSESDGASDDEADPPGKRRPRWGLAGLVAAAALLALVFFPRSREIDYSDLAQIEPLPVRISRAVPEPGSFEESRLLGLDAYASGDLAEAREQLTRAVGMRPDSGEMLLYLGSAELLAGEVEPATGHLEQARSQATDEAVRSEATWQLANAALVEGRPDQATPLLRELAERGGHRSKDAARLLEAMR